MTKYRRVYQAFNDLMNGLMRAQGFYSEMKETVSSLKQNVETFVNNRRSEGGQLLSKIEQSKSSGADQEQQRLKDLMERMSIDPSSSPVSASGAGGARKKSIPAPISTGSMQPQTGYPAMAGHQSLYNPAASPPVTPRYPGTTAPGQSQYMSPSQYSQPQQNNTGFAPPPRRDSSFSTSQSQAPTQQYATIQQQQQYNPNQYNPVSPPAHQQYFSPPPNQHQQGMGHQHGQAHQQQWGSQGGQHQGGQHQGGQNAYQNLPMGYVPPPPPPGPPPSQQQQQGGAGYGGGYPSGPGGYAVNPRQSQQGGQQQGQGQGQDPWAALSGWK